VWSYYLDPARVSANQVAFRVTTEINTNHKDNDVAALGFHGMGRKETVVFKLSDVLAQRQDVQGRAKHGSMIAGPFRSNTDRLHSFRAHFLVTPDN
jgi:hypothetical protein